jgi:hypothetical protein
MDLYLGSGVCHPEIFIVCFGPYRLLGNRMIRGETTFHWHSMEQSAYLNASLPLLLLTEPEASQPCSYEPAIRFYAELYEFSPVFNSLFPTGFESNFI